MEKKKKKWPKIIAIILGIIVALIVLLFAVLTITEHKPEDVETVAIQGSTKEELAIGDSFSIMTWNVGYCGLGETADFFMDGGESVRSSSKEAVNENIDAISKELQASNADFMFLQELDTSSKRSYYTNQLEAFQTALPNFESSYALNYKVLYVPYPWPTIGKVACGIGTFSNYHMTESERIALPCPFTYPTRICNLKRCLMVNRVPLKDSDKELVLVNLHLEAYDDGAGKEAQTKQLRDLLESEVKKGNYVIAGGDFNQTFSSTDTSAYPLVSEDMWVPGVVDESAFGSGLAFYTDNSAPTCRSLDKALKGADSDPSKFQYYMIDGFIVSDNLAVNSVTTSDLKFKNTDHNPVVMNVTVK